jgi:catecholate siderophore receptor
MRKTAKTRGKRPHARAARPVARSWVVAGALAASAAVTAPSKATAATGARDLLVPSVRAGRVDLDALLPEFRGAAWLDRDGRPAEAAWSGPQAPARKDDPPVQRFDIAPGPLDAVLAAFEKATGVTVRLSDERLRRVASPGVSGLFSATQALEQLLAGTGLTFRFVAPGSVVLDVQGVAEAIEVSGTAPAPSSPKLTQPLRDIPQTITVIPSAVIEQQGAATLRDVLRNVAGITFQAGEGGVPAGDQLTIRGFSARTDIFIDGVRDFGGYSRDSFNLAQVEVAKGPSSSLAGRGSTGGTINQVSKAPTLESNYAGVIGAGNADYRRSTIDVNQPLGDIGLESGALRVNAMWTDTGVPGRDRVEGERWGVAPTLALGLATSTRASLGYFHLSQENVPEYGLPWVPANTNPELEAYSNGMPPVDQSNFYGLVTRDYEDTVTDLGTLQVDHDFNPRFTLRNLTRYGKTTRDSAITAPRFASVNTSTAINRQLQSRDMTDTIAANQTNLTSRITTGGLSHAIAAGVEFSRETSLNYARTGPTAPQADLYAPDANQPYPGPITRSGASTDATADSAAAYAFDTVNLGNRWELTGGLRWDRFDVDYESVAATGERTPFSRVDDMVSWRGGLVYKPSPNGSVYAAAGTSFNPSAEGLSLAAATVDLEPEKSRTYEIGSKWDVAGGGLSLTGALFRSEKTNARTPGVNPGDPPTVLAGEQRVDGVELGVAGRVGNWTAFANYAFMSSDIVSSNTAAEVDNALALTPENTLNVWTTYTFPWRLSIGGGVQYMDSVFRNATNSAEVPSYWLINALVSYDVNRHLTLRFNGNNLADEEYVDRVGGGHYIPGPGRSIQVSAGFRF